MPRISVLASEVADQIAAGEVVERPASVLKELVENALDAGATAIDVTIEDGGRALVRVSDDGFGMERDDAVLALERHATSKIRDAADLVGVTSFGFRGEALPAICSVSRLEIDTAPAEGMGTLVRAEGGCLTEVLQSSRRRGTTVAVRSLFFNTPARRKFLRGVRSEARAIADAFTTIALVRRETRLTLTHDGRSLFVLPASETLRGRVAALWGAPTAERLIEVEHVSGPVHVSGLIERPSDVGFGGRRVHLAVNGRAVRDPGLVRAAEAAYRSTLTSGLRPSVMLEIVLPGDLVDVNVHPAKAEVRFRDRWSLERVVEAAARRALGVPASAATLGAPGWSVPGGIAPWGAHPVDVEMLSPAARPEAGLLAGSTAVGLETRRRPEEPEADEDALETPVPPLVQLRRTYLMFEREDGVVLIDQHAAHERILYERFMRTLERGEGPSQRLLFPLTLHLGPAEADAFEENRELLERLGFEVEGFGGHTLLVRSVPMPHPRFDAERCIRETLAALAGDRLAATAAKHERLAATVACKAAVKGGDVLAPDEMRALFRALGRATLPAHDVHGRATLVHLSWDELDRRFGRR